MIGIGLDIGTTTISAVAADTQCGVLDAVTVANASFVTTPRSFEKMQLPEKIWDTAFACLQKLLQKHPDCACIGVTGQQHGIVYLDRDGHCVSPLYTWQDGRSGLPAKNGQTYAQVLSARSGYSIPVGYGMATHDYNMQNGLVPSDAVVFCTIQDYVAMRLAGQRSPRIDASNASSFGLFRLEDAAFDHAGAKRAQLYPAYFPNVVPASILGAGFKGIPVCTAIGDNQASFIGATDGQNRGALLNVGTGSQISIWMPTLQLNTALEIRPFPLGGYLMVGAAICGGRAYAILERFFRQIVEMATGQSISCYTSMAALATQEHPKNPPHFTTTFQGTRSDPAKCGGIDGLTEANFTPADFIYGLLNGTVDELYDLYMQCLSAGVAQPKWLYGSGNGLRRNALLQDLIQKRFGLPLQLCPNEEEAAYGAALYAIRTLSMEQNNAGSGV